MKRGLAIGLLLACFPVLCGCAAGVIALGAAAGAGTAYVAGEDTRRYDAEYPRAVDVCMQTLDSLQIRLVQTQSTESRTTIEARTADHTPVQIEVQSVAPAVTTIGIRTGKVGISELDASKRIHAALMDRFYNAPAPLEAAAASRRVEPVEKRPEMKAIQEIARKTEERSKAPLAKRTPAGLTIYFGVNSNELRPSEIAKLDRLVETIRKKPDARLALSGFTDAAGPSDYNQMVSESRASVVKLYFMAKGLDPNRISVVGKGARDFAAANNTEEGRNLNRRVEINIIAK